MLKEITNFHVGSVTAVQNPLRYTDDLLDDKLGELNQSSVLIFFSGTILCFYLLRLPLLSFDPHPHGNSLKIG